MNATISAIVLFGSKIVKDVEKTLRDFLIAHLSSYFEKENAEFLARSLILEYNNKKVEVSLPGAEISDIDSLKYFFQKYLFSVENGKPSQSSATILKIWIDIIQQKSNNE